MRSGIKDKARRDKLRTFNHFGAAEKTRTSTGFTPTATSTLRVYQFRHGRNSVAARHRHALACGGYSECGPCDQAQDERFISTMNDYDKNGPSETGDSHLNTPVEWRISDDPVDYPGAVEFMEHRVQEIRDGTKPETVWLLEHPPLYTSGTSADPADLVEPGRFPVFETGRGGQYTYHGPGQRVAYVMLDLKHRGADVRKFVHDLEEWAIRTLAQFNIIGERREGRVGIWVRRGAPDTPAVREDKIAAIGVRVRKWVTYHGISINVDPDLGHFDGIVPCGISEHGVTSLWDLGNTPSMSEVDTVMRSTFEDVFNGTITQS